MEFLSGMWLAILGVFGLAPEPEQAVPVTEVVQEDVAVPETAPVIAESEAEVVEASKAPEEIGVAEEPADLPVEPVEDASTVGGAGAGMTGGAVSLDQLSAPAPEPVVTGPDIKTALVAGGCFWCVEADLEKTAGVISAVSGYAGGSTANPTYNNYGSGGHREVVEVTYDANQISYEEILIVTMKTTDPTDDEGTFADRGDKYSAAFYYETAAQKQIIDNLIAEVDEFGPYDKPLAIDIEPRPKFWAAEDNHQDYYKGTLTKLKYQYYRNASGRSDFIEKYWGVNDHSPKLPWRSTNNQTSVNQNETKTYAWTAYRKPDDATLKAALDPLTYKVTQQDGTERSGTHWLDKNWERGIYVDILSGEPLYSSRDKYDSGTGWPSFVRPISDDALTLHEDRKLFSVRTETRSAIADNHLGHVFNDGPADRGGLRYCMNGAALRFVPEAEMVGGGYSDFLSEL